MLPIFVAALAVIAGMLVMADYARREADQARQAQAVMERTRTLGAGIDSLTWRTLATRETERTDAVLSEGLGSVQAVDGELAPPASARRAAQPHRGRRAAPRRGLRPGNAGTARLPARRRGGRAHREARFRSRHASLRRRHRRRSPREQDGIARAAQQRTWLGWLGSLTIGLLLLCLLGCGCTGSSGGPRSPSRRATPSAAARSDCDALVRHSSDVVAVVDGTSHVRWLAESVRGALGL